LGPWVFAFRGESTGYRHLDHSVDAIDEPQYYPDSRKREEGKGHLWRTVDISENERKRVQFGRCISPWDRYISVLGFTIMNTCQALCINGGVRPKPEVRGSRHSVTWIRHSPDFAEPLVGLLVVTPPSTYFVPQCGHSWTLPHDAVHPSFYNGHSEPTTDL
jgi:hypothetical protein